MDSVAVRYANALRSLAVEENRLTDYKVMMKATVAAFKQNPDLTTLLSSAFIKINEKRETIDHLFGKTDLKSFVSFLKVIVEHKRIHEFPSIAKEFIKFANETLGIEEGIIYSTILLTSEKIAEIEKTISDISHTTVELINEIDLSLIGGIKVVVHDRIYDGSVSTMIQSLQTELLKRKVINREN
ncbi:MAG: ATP synthase F1 subunit delta [Firmicutes bacterium]|nr:ATP synthase F1 subunit delta [Bacillota bacterium]